LDGEAVEVVLRFDPELRERMKEDLRKALGKEDKGERLFSCFAGAQGKSPETQFSPRQRPATRSAVRGD